MPESGDGLFIIPELARRTRPLIEGIYAELKGELAGEGGIKKGPAEVQSILEWLLEVLIK